MRCVLPLLNLWVFCCPDSESIQCPVHRHSVPRPSWKGSGAEEGAKEKVGQEEGSAGTTRLAGAHFVQPSVCLLLFFLIKCHPRFKSLSDCPALKAYAVVDIIAA